MCLVGREILMMLLLYNIFSGLRMVYDEGLEVIGMVALKELVWWSYLEMCPWQIYYHPEAVPSGCQQCPL